MKIASFNINGVKARLPALLDWLREAEPDVVALQEIKSTDDQFPRLEIEELGYNIETHGQKGFNGVAILSKAPLEDVVRGLPTLVAHRRARAQSARIGEVTDRYRRASLGTLRIAFLSGTVLELAATLGIALVAVTVGVRLVDSDVGFEAALTPETRMVWVETPSNPLLRLTDLRAIAQLCRARGIISVADNTFASPYIQRPLELGFDVVVHSTTKYLNGHSDVIGGIAIVGDNPDLRERLGFLQNSVGAISGPFDAFLTLRGVKTLALRMERHCSNALALAQWLERQPQVARVYYPGLASHPQHELAKRQMRGFGGMISLDLRCDLAGARRFLENVRIFSLAESLGGVESLIEHPAIMTHASIPAETRAELGIGDSLIRLSVGVEALEDLQADLAQALAKI